MGRGVQGACVHINKNPRVGMYGEEIGLYLCLSSSVSPTNSVTPSDLIYLVDSSGSWLGAWSGLFPGCAAPDSLVDPHLLIVVHRSYGWKNYLGLHCTVSWILISIFVGFLWDIVVPAVSIDQTIKYLQIDLSSYVRLCFLLRLSFWLY